MSGLASGYMGYADLAKSKTEGKDYKVLLRPVAGSSSAVIAPHGGRIEHYTSDIARGIAGDDFNLYLFEGVRLSGNYSTLHLTSHRFRRAVLFLAFVSVRSRDRCSWVWR